MDAPRAAPAAFPVPPPPRLPGLGGALGLAAMYFLLQFVLGGLLGLLYAFAQGLAGRAGGDLRTMLGQPDVRVAMVVATVLGSALAVLAMARRLWPLAWGMPRLPGLGFARAEPPFYLAALALGVAVPFAGGLLTRLLADGHAVPQDIRDLGGQASLALRLALLLTVTTLGPLVEELLFRGALLSALARRLPVGMAAAASAALFALAHLPDLDLRWYALPNLALLGAALAWLRLRSGSIWPAVLAHATNNLLAALAWFAAG
jgi:hypothetical protein